MITVSPLNAVPGLIQEYGIRRVLGLLGPDIDHPELGLPDDAHLRMTFNDISTPMTGNG